MAYLEESSDHDLVQAIVTTMNDARRDIVEDTKAHARAEYSRIKSIKQRELNSGTSGRISKQQKKRIDNHASAVASRFKQEYLIRQFSETVIRKTNDCVTLVRYIRRFHDECTQLKNTVAKMKEIMQEQRNENMGLKKRLEVAEALSAPANLHPRASRSKQQYVNSVQVDASTVAADQCPKREQNALFDLDEELLSYNSLVSCGSQDDFELYGQAFQEYDINSNQDFQPEPSKEEEDGHLLGTKSDQSTLNHVKVEI